MKSIVATSEAGTLGASVAVGEVVRYRLAVQVPRSTLTNFQLVDTLVAGLSYLPGTARVMFVSNPAGSIASSTITAPAAQQTSLATTPTAALGDPSVAGTVYTFGLGDLVNSATGAGVEYVVIEFDALVLNGASNQSGTGLDNAFQTFINGVANGAVSAPVAVTVAEPVVGITENALASNVGLSELIPARSAPRRSPASRPTAPGSRLPTSNSAATPSRRPAPASRWPSARPSSSPSRPY